MSIRSNLAAELDTRIRERVAQITKLQLEFKVIELLQFPDQNLVFPVGEHVANSARFGVQTHKNTHTASVIRLRNCAGKFGAWRLIR